MDIAFMQRRARPCTALEFVDQLLADLAVLGVGQCHECGGLQLRFAIPKQPADDAIGP